ncbi:MAG: hypothetical protein M3160_09740, partial [Candidatus Eremiobacteraeota bacterium]|nr:hypothetical protein [Candidatus Eremiobacteraeota bacterium]
MIALYVRSLVLATLILMAACARQTRVVTFSGYLLPGKTVSVSNVNGDVAAYPPAAGQQRDQYTVQATLPGVASGPVPLEVTKTPAGLSIVSRSKLSMKL